MRIGIASPISTYFLKEYLHPESASIAENLSNHDGPAVTNLARSFLEMGHALVIFTKDYQAKKHYVLDGEKIRIYIVPSNLSGWRKVLGKLYIYDMLLLWRMFTSTEKLDVLSAQWTRDYAIGARHYFGKCPVTCTVRDVLPVISKMQSINKITLWQNEFTMNCKKYKFIANSEYTQDMIRKLWHKESVIIHNGISQTFLDYQPAEKYDKFTFVTITTAIDGRKNVEKMLCAFNRFHSSNPNTQLLLVGPPFTKQNPNVMRWKEQGLLNGIVLMGAKTRSELKEILTKSHCLFHPALEETFGNILVEAMACKCLPIGGAHSGAVPYVLSHGKSGILCDVTDIPSMAEAMNNAFSNNHEELINVGFKSVHTKYSPSVVSQKYIDLFDHLIHTNR